MAAVWQPSLVLGAVLMGVWAVAGPLGLGPSPREPAEAPTPHQTGTNGWVAFTNHVTSWNDLFPLRVMADGITMFEITPLVTNRWTNVVRVLEEEPVATPCPECGGPDHHDRQVARMQVHERVSASVVYRGQTNHVVVWAGVVTNWIGTNLVMRQRRQPGWTVPPTPPPLTNAPNSGGP